jgi:lipopolysaccharide exporter
MAAGAGWMILLRFADRGIGLVSLAVLARLLAPEDFGLIALALSFMGLIALFGHFGVEMALIQNQNAERRHYDSAWTVTLITAAVFSTLFVALAAAAASFFRRSAARIDHLLASACQLHSRFRKHRRR